MGFGIAKFRTAKFSHCEIGIGSANLKFALRNGIWHCEMAFSIAKFRIAKFSHCEIGIGEFSHCEMGLRNFRIAKWVCEQFAKISFC